MALQVRRTSPTKVRAIVTLVALFALVAQPMYGLVASQVAEAASVGAKTVQAVSYHKGPDSDCDRELATPKCKTIEDAIRVAEAGDTVRLNGNFSAHKQITVSKAITIDGNGRTVWGEFNRTSHNNNAIFGLQAAATIHNVTINGKNRLIHGINAWHTNGTAKIENVTISRMGNSGLLVGEQAQVVAGGLSISGSAWSEINVDKDGARLHLTGVNSFSENSPVPAIYLDKGDASQLQLDNPSAFAVVDSYDVPKNPVGNKAYFPAYTDPVIDNFSTVNGTVLGDITNSKDRIHLMKINVSNAPSDVYKYQYQMKFEGESGDRTNPVRDGLSVWIAGDQVAAYGDGVYTYSVRYQMFDGGPWSAWSSRSIKRDTTAPANINVTYTGGLGSVESPTPVTGEVVGGDVTFRIAMEEANPSNMYAEINWLNPETNKWDKRGKGWGKTITSNSGTLTLPSTAPSGTYQIKVSSIRDKAGNEAATQTFKFTVDNAKPVIDSFEFVGAKGGNNYNPTKIKAYAEDEGSFVTNVYIHIYKKNSEGKWIVQNGNPMNQGQNFAEITNLWKSDGQYKVAAWSKDKTGNVGAVKEAEFTVDTTSPSFEVTSRPDAGSLKESQVVFEGTASGVDLREANGRQFVYATVYDLTASPERKDSRTFHMFIKEDGTWTLDTSTNAVKSQNEITLGDYLVDGREYLVTFKALDILGNPTVAASSVFTIDNTDPEDSVVDEDDSNPKKPSSSRHEKVNTEDDTVDNTANLQVFGLASVLGTVAPNFAVANQNGETDEDATNESDGSDILGAAESTSPLANTAAIAGDSTKAGVLGLAWYWWLLILAAVIGTVWYLIAAARRKSQEA